MLNEPLQAVQLVFHKLNLFIFTRNQKGKLFTASYLLRCHSSANTGCGNSHFEGGLYQKETIHIFPVSHQNCYQKLIFWATTLFSLVGDRLDSSLFFTSSWQEQEVHKIKQLLVRKKETAPLLRITQKKLPPEDGNHVSWSKGRNQLCSYALPGA